MDYLRLFLTLQLRNGFRLGMLSDGRCDGTKQTFIKSRIQWETLKRPPCRQHPRIDSRRGSDLFPGAPV